MRVRSRKRRQKAVPGKHTKHVLSLLPTHLHQLLNSSAVSSLSTAYSVRLLPTSLPMRAAEGSLK